MSAEENEKHVLETDLQNYGAKVAPLMQDLSKKMPNLVSAMLCTTEGFNICSIGFDNEAIAKMAAVSSSLYAMAKSVLVAFSGNKQDDINVISINSDDMDILGRKIALSNERSLILIVASRDTQPGVQLYAAKSVEEKIKELLSPS